MQMVMPLFANYRDYSSFGIIMAKYAEFDVPNINSTGANSGMLPRHPDSCVVAVVVVVVVLCGGGGVLPSY